MGHPFGHPSAKPLLERVASVFSEEEIFFRADRKIIFVCGGSPADDSKYLRAQFLSTAKNELPKFRMLLAEAAMEELGAQGEPRRVNIAEFESLISQISDCILLFPESPGSFAELGFFSAKANIRRYLFVANDYEQQSDSFINNGPLDLVARHSHFRPVYVRRDTAETDFGPVIRKLNEEARIYRTRFEKKPFNKLPWKHRLYLVLEMIRIFSVINVEGLFFVLHKTFGSVDAPKLRKLLSILKGMGYVAPLGSDPAYYKLIDDKQSFVDIDSKEIDEIRSDVLLYYVKHSPHVSKLVKECETS